MRLCQASVRGNHFDGMPVRTDDEAASQFALSLRRSSCHRSCSSHSIGKDTLQTYASLDALTIRPWAWYRPSWYVAPQVSLLDLLGPFSEVATRGQLFDDSAHKALVFGLGILAPRAEIMVGSPLLSRNIVVGAGVTVRAYRGVMTGATTAEYCVLGKACATDRNERGPTSDNLEVGVYVRYVP